MGLVNTLGSYACRTSYGDLPGPVVAAAKERILDLLGAAIAGNRRGFHKPVLEVARAIGGKDEATVIGEERRFPRTLAALVNSAMCADLADGDRVSMVHPSMVVIPAALATAEAEAGSGVAGGKDLILAVVLGYEVMMRLGRDMNPSARERGFALTGVAGPLGAAAAAGSLMRLDEAQMAHALATASILGSGLMEAYKAPQRTFVQVQGARASESGVMAALLARAGVKGNDMILEAGFLPAYGDRYSPGLITKDLGRDYMLPRTYLKLYAGHAHTHAPVEAVLDILHENAFGPGDIEQVKVKVVSSALVLNIEEPDTVASARQSFPFCIAVALLYGDAFDHRFSDENLGNPQIRHLMKRVKVVNDPDLEREYPARRSTIVEVTTGNGRLFSHRLDFAKGQPERPLSKSEIERKFQSLASGMLDADAIARIVDFAGKLETMPEMTDLFAWLRQVSPGRL